jgi:hypothetical protein
MLKGLPVRRKGSQEMRASIAALVVVAVLGLIALVYAASASAATAHALDPTLSLAGAAGAEGTNSVDSTPDPGSAHPEKPFEDPCGVTVDSYGDIYVASAGSTPPGGEPGEAGRIDVFNANGEFLTEVKDSHWPCSLAVTSTGQLYVYQAWSENVARYEPISYEPSAGQISYDATSVTIADKSGGSEVFGVGLNPSNDHVYLTRATNKSFIEDWTAEQEEGNPGTNRFGEGEVQEARSVAVWGQNGDVYVSGSRLPTEPLAPRAYVVDGSTRLVKQTLDGSATPDGAFGFTAARAGVAVDQANGDLYVGDIAIHHAVDQFEAPETVAPGEEAPEKYIGQIKLGSSGLKASNPSNGVAVDEGEHSPNRGYVYVTSGETRSNSHLYAFAPVETKPPSIRNEQATRVGEDEALLTAELNPNGFATSYRFEYGTADCVVGPCQSVPVPPAEASPSNGFEPISVPVSGLTAGEVYHFRLVATSHCNLAEPEEECVSEGPDATFSTYPAQPAPSCANAAYRLGASARLPDCRVYELVTPSETNGRIPGATVFGEGTDSTPVLLAAEDGESAVFGTDGGGLPGIGGGGFHDTYLSRRGVSGWGTEFTGLDGEQAEQPFSTGVSFDHAYSLWKVEGSKGSLTDPAGGERTYVRGPGGTIEPVGIGNRGTDPDAASRWISAGDHHLIFTSSARLENDAPPSLTAIYDRTPGGPTRVVSLPPIGASAETKAEFETIPPIYRGASEDGSAVAFDVGPSSSETLYVRMDDVETLAPPAPPGSTFAGLSKEGQYLFYIAGGNILRFDTSSQSVRQIGSGGESIIVNISADGSHVYFVSPDELSTGGTPGQENLYGWDAASGAVRFIATVEEEDVIGEPSPPGGELGAMVGGLDQWISDVVATGRQQGEFTGPANDPSRTSPDGDVFAFESRARLTSYDNEGHTEIYRYEYATDQLICISCSPIGAPPSSDAHLEARYAVRLHSIPPLNALSVIRNVAGGGAKVFFESGDALSARDIDGSSDIYEWEASGTGGCASSFGCVELISSGRSTTANYLYGVGDVGRDVFFWTTDVLAAQDHETAPSIYDARAGGGFPEPVPSPGECVGEACQAPPLERGDSTPSSLTFHGPGNARPRHRRCRRRTGHRRSRKARCHKRHSHKQLPRNDRGEAP